ncbi:MAG: LD-carboxypeptidase [Fibrobacter sp.]|nr:LD-carboxypeptidase [Fibrobacter sp.]
MKDLLLPKRLQIGDKVATVSLSSGLAGEEKFKYKYELGVKRLYDVFGLEAVPMANSLRGCDFLYKNPKARADDLMQAICDPEIKAIISNIGGEESLRILPYLDLDLIRKNPKIFMGYSDSTSVHYMFYKAGVTSYYGPAIMTDFAENNAMFDYTVNSIKRTLFNAESFGELKSSEKWTCERLEWADQSLQNVSRKLEKNKGHEFINGKGVIQGKLIGGCIVTFQSIRSTSLFPEINDWNDSILFIETPETKPDPMYFRYWIRDFGFMGILQRVKGILVGKPYEECYYEEYKNILLEVVRDEFGLSDLPIVYNMNFGHAAPLSILPYGVSCKIDCGNKKVELNTPSVE